MEENIVNSVNEGQENVVDSQIEEQVEPTEQGAEQVEVADQPEVDKPVQTPEENAKFAQVRREAEARARDKVIADMGMTWEGRPISTYDEYVKAKEASDQQAKEQAIRDKYQSQGLPEEVIEELVESKKFRESSVAEKKKAQEEERKQSEYREFFEYFRNEHGKDFNASEDTIPPEVWEMVSKGKSLTDAYAINHAKELKAKIAEYEAKLQANEVNQSNASSSPGSVTGNGTAADSFISSEVFEANKHDRNWIMKNYNKIIESRPKW